MQGVAITATPWTWHWSGRSGGSRCPAFLTTAVTLAATWGVNAVLVNQPNGYFHMGLFNAANQWRALGIFIPSVFNPATFSIQSNLFATNRGVVPPLGHRQSGRPEHGRGGGGDRADPLLAVPHADVRTSSFKARPEVLVLLAMGWFLVVPSGAFLECGRFQEARRGRICMFIAIGAVCQFVVREGLRLRAARAASRSPSCTPG